MSENHVIPDATELEYLKWFRQHADFGPADCEVKTYMHEDFEKETGTRVPKNWRYEEE